MAASASPAKGGDETPPAFAGDAATSKLLLPGALAWVLVRSGSKDLASEASTLPTDQELGRP